MEIEVHQRGGVLGLDRRYLVKDGTVEVIEKGRSRGSKELDPQQAARIDELASAAATADVRPADLAPSDAMETKLYIRSNASGRRMQVRTGDDAPDQVWELIRQVSRASGV